MPGPRYLSPAPVFPTDGNAAGRDREAMLTVFRPTLEILPADLRLGFG